MRLKSMLLLAVASGCGLVAMFIFQMSRSNSASAEEKVQVLFASAEIAPGSRLDETNTEFREYPLSLIPENAVVTAEEFKDRAIKVRAFPNDMITVDKLVDAGAANDIPKGMMTVTIPVDASMASGGMLAPGDRVDVLVTYPTAGRVGLGKDIKTVVEYVEIWATDNKREVGEVGSDTKATKTVTLLVSPPQVRLVKLAEECGKLHLATRSRADATARATDKELFNPAVAEEVNLAKRNDELNRGREEKPEDLDQFLKENTKPVVPLVASIQQPAAPDTWQIEIFAGDERRVETVPLRPADKVELQGGNPLLNGLKALFGREKKAETAPSAPTAGTELDLPVPVPAGPSA